MYFLLENINIPPSEINEIQKFKETYLAEISKEIDDPTKIIKSFEIKPELNPNIWDEEKLKPEIKNRLIKIAKDFFNELELSKTTKLKDILLVGSLANYNWSEYSDIDLHLIVDFTDINSDTEFVKNFFDNERKLWNDEHNIEIKNFNVEIYVQDIKEKVTSAVYSIPNDKWIVKPKKEKVKLDKKLIINKAKNIISKLEKIKDLYDNGDYQKCIDLITELQDKIKQTRKIGLEKGGEYSTNNLIFKVLRRTDFIEIINNIKAQAYDKQLSI